MTVNEIITNRNPEFTYSFKPHPLDNTDDWNITSVKSMLGFANVTIDRENIPSVITVTPKALSKYEDIIQISLVNNGINPFQTCKRRMLEFGMNVDTEFKYYYDCFAIKSSGNNGTNNTWVQFNDSSVSVRYYVGNPNLEAVHYTDFIQSGHEKVYIPDGKVLYLYSDVNTSYEDSSIFTFYASPNLMICEGDIMKLLKDEELTKEYAFKGLFKNNLYINSTPVLPSTDLTVGCYQEMFSGCSNLTSTPALPASVVPDYAYKEMFKNCTSLVSLTEWFGSNVTSVGVGAFEGMFEGCTGLDNYIIQFELPSSQIDIPERAYMHVFKDCTYMYECRIAPGSGGETYLGNCGDYAFYGFFLNCKRLIIHDNAYHFRVQSCGEYTFARMYENTNLKKINGYIRVQGNCGTKAFYRTFADNKNMIEARVPSVHGRCAAGAFSETYKGCSNITEIRNPNILSNASTAFESNWLDGLPATGTYHYPIRLLDEYPIRYTQAEKEQLIKNDYHIPAGWTMKWEYSI